MSDLQQRECIHFGSFDWIVLAEEDDSCLILSEKVVEKRAYHEALCDLDWSCSDLRTYLNTTFLNRFSEEGQAKILEVTLDNHDNPWDGTAGGGQTRDRVFLPSIDEVILYFGDSGQIESKPLGPKGESWWISDAFDQDRIGNFGSRASWWWLRSPGYISQRAAYVTTKGHVHIHGESSGSKGKLGGVRPMLRLKRP